MLKSGDGATGIVACVFNGRPKDKGGHMLNVVNIKGKVWIIDTQAVSRGYLLTLEEFQQKFYYIHLMNTTGVKQKIPPLKPVSPD